MYINVNSFAFKALKFQSFFSSLDASSGFELSCFQPFSWPSAIWGSRNPLKLPSPAQRNPYPDWILASIRLYPCTITWIFTQTQFARISSILTQAISFFFASEPFISPQNLAASLIACFASALAPTDSFEATAAALAELFNCSSVRLVCKVLKLSIN